MIIITDNKTYTRELLQRDLHWIDTPNIIPSSIQTLCEKIFPDTAIFSGMVSDINDWNYMFVTESAKRSQYDVLIEAARIIQTLPDKIICFAGSGKKFHGFKNRMWAAEPGNIHLSILFSPNKIIKNFQSAFLAMPSVSIVETLDTILGLKNQSKIKWVNDILIDDYKVSGVLAHSITSGSIVNHAIIGIGLNIDKTPDIQRDIYSPPPKALNDFMEPDKIDYRDVLPILMKKLTQNYHYILKDSIKELLNTYQDRLAYKNKMVRLYNDQSEKSNSPAAKGLLKGVTDNLELILEGHPEPIRTGRIVLSPSD